VQREKRLLKDCLRNNKDGGERTGTRKHIWTLPEVREKGKGSKLLCKLKGRLVCSRTKGRLTCRSIKGEKNVLLLGWSLTHASQIRPGKKKAPTQGKRQGQVNSGEKRPRAAGGEKKKAGDPEKRCDRGQAGLGGGGAKRGDEKADRRSAT